MARERPVIAQWLAIVWPLAEESLRVIGQRLAKSLLLESTDWFGTGSESMSSYILLEMVGGQLVSLNHFSILPVAAGRVGEWDGKETSFPASRAKTFLILWYGRLVNEHLSGSFIVGQLVISTARAPTPNSYITR